MSSVGALEHIRVIDLTSVLAGPGGTQILGDLGADVIKVEAPTCDETRRMGPSVYHDGSATSFLNVNRNKRCISIDLKREDGREVLLRLLEDADVLVENFKPGTLEKWGLSYEEVLSKRFPKLIYCQLTAFGNDGPLGGLPGYDPLAQAYSGIISLGGFPGGEPLRVNVPVTDWTAALYSVIAIQGALIERSRSGRGQAIEVTLYDSAFSLLHPFACNYLLKGIVAERIGNNHPSIAPYDVYPTRDGNVIFMTNNLRQFGALCDALGLDDLKADERMQTNAGRVAHIDVLTETLKPIFAQVNTTEIVARLTAAGVPIAPVLDVGQALEHEHAAARGLVVEGENGYRGVASPIRLSRTPVNYRRMPATHGEHTREVLGEACLSEEEINSLIERGVVVG